MNTEVTNREFQVFYDNPPAIEDFEACLVRIVGNIEKAREIPQEQREFEEW